MELVSHGTLSTVGEDSVPLGTYASYVLDGEGQPILRLREQAVHTANILRNPRCSLFVQPEDMPARLLARATLIGRVCRISRAPALQCPRSIAASAASKVHRVPCCIVWFWDARGLLTALTQQVEKVDDATAEEAARRHGQLHFGGVGVDAPQPTDLFYRLIIERCFYVGGMGSACKAEDLSAEDYKVGQLQSEHAVTCQLQSLNANSAILVAPFCSKATLAQSAVIGQGINPYVTTRRLLCIPRPYVWDLAHKHHPRG